MKALRSDNDQEISTTKNDYTEMMEYYRKEKFRSDLFLNKLQGPVSQTTKPIIINSGLNMSDQKRKNSIVKLTKVMKLRTNIKFDTLSPTGYTSMIPTSFNIIENKGFSSDCRLTVVQSYQLKLNSMKSDRFDSNENFRNKSNTKIIFSPKMKEKFNEKSHFNELKIKIETKNMNSVQNIINSAKEKPVKLFKNQKKLIFFKDRIIEIENDENKTTRDTKTENPKEDDLFMKIIKHGNSPTKFFLRKKNPNKFFP